MSGRARLAVLPLAVLLALGVGDSKLAQGYRFLAWSNPDVFGKGEQFKPRWNPAVWGPGQTLEVALVEDPLWLTLDAFEDEQEVRDLVRRALAAWSSIGSADIRWRLAEGPVEDPAVTIQISADAVHPGGFPGVAQTLGKIQSDGWRTSRCEVLISQEGTDRWSASQMLNILTHELGHCLGLDHHAAPPNDLVYDLPYAQGMSWWGRRGVMTVRGLVRRGLVTHTETIGASLLRPATGWLETTGAVYGMVRNSDLEPGRRRTVLLFGRVGFDGMPRDAVTRLTDRRGRFVVEGLDPGTYIVMMYGLIFGDEWEGVGTLREGVRLQTVEVRAGERTGPLILTARHWAEAE